GAGARDVSPPHPSSTSTATSPHRMRGDRYGRRRSDATWASIISCPPERFPGKRDAIMPPTGLTDLRDRVAVITGASSGIGAQLARDLAARGAHCALLARRADRLQAVALECARAGVTALPVPCDVAERAAVEGAGATVLEHFGHVDLLV